MSRLWSFPVMSRVGVVAMTFLAGAGWGALGLAPERAGADVDYVFNVNCAISHFNSDDPIVHPRQPGVSHRHAFYGNTSTNAQTTTASLLGTRSTCDRGFDTADRSAYWVPTLYRKLPDGTVHEVALPAGDQYLAAYYRRSGGSDGEKVKPFPKGLRMVSGNPFATKPQSTLTVAWRCNAGGGEYQATIPNCPAGSKLQAIVGFPDCWDGRHLDSADHRSHMASSRGERGSCPSSHPVKLPNVTFEITFALSPVAGSTYELSSGGRYSLHGDFFAAWDDRVQSALVNSCLNGDRYCENIKRSEVDLTAAGPVPRGVEPVISAPGARPSAAASAHPGHAVATAPSATAVLGAAAEPADGGSTFVIAVLGGAVGALAVGSVLYYWRRLAPTGRRRAPYARAAGSPAPAAPARRS